MLVVKVHPPSEGKLKLKPSAYNMTADALDGQLIIVNTLVGSRVLIPSGHRERVLALLSAGTVVRDEVNKELFDALAQTEMLVPTESNEQRKLRYLQAFATSSSRSLNLIVMPTEKCNFRCTYCYEDFVQGKMAPRMRTAVKALARARVGSLDRMSIEWFGGEPLLALDVIEDILPEISEVCQQSSCKLSSSMTTNGYLLKPETARQLLDWGIDSFQITLDGPREFHDERRRLNKGKNVASHDTKGTFDVIWGNVRSLLAQRRIFNLILRTNYDLESLPAMTGWIDTIAELTNGDPRVRVDFCPVWADPCKVEVSIPMGDERQRTHVGLLAVARSRGLQTHAPGYLELGGLVCYAAKSNSFVIRSDGAINKCTVALDADYNAVGHLLDDGTMRLNLDRLAKWTNSGLEDDEHCQGCSLSASCQGNACPLERFENGNRPCPPAKNFPDAILRMAIPTKPTK